MHCDGSFALAGYLTFTCINWKITTTITNNFHVRCLWTIIYCNASNKCATKDSFILIAITSTPTIKQTVPIVPRNK